MKRAGGIRSGRIRFHDLRHTCATLLLTKGVFEMLGHANVSSTLDTYSHVIPGLGSVAATAMEEAQGHQRGEANSVGDL